MKIKQIIKEEFESKPIMVGNYNGKKLYWFDGEFTSDIYDPEVEEAVNELADSIHLNIRTVHLTIFVAKKPRKNKRDDIVAALWYDNEGFHIVVADDYQNMGIGSELVNFAMHEKKDDYLCIQVTDDWLRNLLQKKYGLVPVQGWASGTWVTNDPSRASGGT